MNRIDSKQTLAYVLSLVIIISYSITIIIVSLSLLVKIAILPVYFPLSILLSSIVINKLYYKENLLKQLSKCLIGLMLIFLFTTTVAMFAFDFTMDGQAYHTPMVILLLNGWDPIYVHSAEVFAKTTQLPLMIAHPDSWFVHLSHHSKAYEMVLASYDKLIGHIINPMALSLPLLFATNVIVNAYLKKYFLLNKYLQILLAALITLNPIFITQLGASYIDGILACYLTILIFMLMDYVQAPEKITLFIIAFLVIFICNLKLTGFVFIAILSLGFTYLLWSMHSFKVARLFLVTQIITVLFAMIIVGFNPFVTNTIVHHYSFLYPFINFSNEGVQQLTAFANSDFLAQNHFAKFIVSLFSYGNSGFDYPIFSFPVSPNTLLHYHQRYGGFGAYFGVIFLTSLIAMLFIKNRVYLITAFIILCSVLIIPDCWWARYVPEAWLLPIIIILGIIADSKDVSLNATRSTMVSLILVALVCNQTTSLPTITSYFIAQKQMQQLAQDVKNNNLQIIIDSSYCNLGATTVKNTLDYMNIANSYSDKLPCQTQYKLPSDILTYCISATN